MTVVPVQGPTDVDELLLRTVAVPTMQGTEQGGGG